MENLLIASVHDRMEESAAYKNESILIAIEKLTD